ncbi:hypothetical protein VYU27_008365 [Nannochloropsis oceanica]
MESLGRYAAPLFMGASLLYALGQKHRRDVTKERQEGAHNRILVTGGAGYIGSHTVLLLLEAGYEVVVVDNMVNSCEESLRRVGELTGKAEKITFCKTDLLDKGGLEHVFLTYGRFRACIHFAGLKAVGESVAKPLLYYENNLTGTLNLLDAMQRHGCKIIVFSSSATVYGSAESPVVEEQTVGQGITNPYGQTKYFIEKFLEDFQRSPEGEEGRGGGREGGRDAVSPFLIPALIANTAAGTVAIELGLKGPNYCSVSACASGTHTIGDAFFFLQNGMADVCVTGGTEAAITPLCFAGFVAIRALTTSGNDDPTKASKPFDKNRAGPEVPPSMPSLLATAHPATPTTSPPPIPKARGWRTR